ncbi:hypothetical protein [Ornithinimicrobium sp. INDO-MA30-4]|uniref:hypothetical protein n=1 Tax=Ornithinimicrobium sp. INDO-MA30-4 TaxID=2908651 RepID=UPI001F455DBB|nr:hypothetical protein [Ornithinimicrobium sp. INDO-MA30-4]UJH69587.1 hypothetical protein L0A91_09460 [Ornithinimicrobium sp. INDO-MA30-4]
MEISKQKIIDMLKNRGDHDKAQKAESDLPEKVDTEKDQGTLEKFGINLSDLTGGFSL